MTDPHQPQNKRLRRALIEAARVWSMSAVTGGWAKGYCLRDTAIDSDSGTAPLIGDNTRALVLLRDLTRKGLIEERAAPDRPLHRGERWTLAHCEFRLTEKGARLLDEREPIDPDVQDLRVELHL